MLVEATSCCQDCCLNMSKQNGQYRFPSCRTRWRLSRNLCLLSMMGNSRLVSHTLDPGPQAAPPLELSLFLSLFVSSFITKHMYRKRNGSTCRVSICRLAWSSDPKPRDMACKIGCCSWARNKTIPGVAQWKGRNVMYENYKAARARSWLRDSGPSGCEGDSTYYQWKDNMFLPSRFLFGFARQSWTKSYRTFCVTDLEKLKKLSFHSVYVTDWCAPPRLPLSSVRLHVSKVMHLSMSSRWRGGGGET